MELTVLLKIALYIGGAALVLLGLILLWRQRTDRQAGDPERGDKGRSEGR